MLNGECGRRWRSRMYLRRKDGVAWITINRPEVRNAFRAQTVDEMVAAFRDAWADARRRRRRAHRRRRQGVLLRRRPEGARRPAATAAATGHRPRRRVAAQRDSQHSEAGHRHGERLRDRRRPRAARALRPVDRGRHGDLRSDRAARRQRRPGLRHGLPGAHRRREEGARDLVPLPAVHARTRRCRWDW